MRTRLSCLGAAAIVAVSMTTARDADACGGCFHGETPTVVTDHRMILSVSKDQSTLYDQIKYSGSPASFAWVLPISGEVTVGLSADVLFDTLDRQTQVQVMPPPRNCPPPPSGCFFGADAASASFSPTAGGVDVLRREVVGPYETVQLKASTPNALRTWLETNGFKVPPEVAPVIDQYVAEKFDFLALKLLPQKGVQDMRPVRVTTKGANVALPLRMVAAGTGATVGISLWVVGEGRYEPQSFPSFVIKSEDISWDWTQNKSNYVDLRTAKTSEGGGRIWEIESSLDIPRQTIEGIVKQGAFPGAPAQPSSGYVSETDAQNNVTKTADVVRDEDLAALFAGIAAPRITRMRADLAHASLNTDLVMAAAKDQGLLSNVRNVAKELNQPLCPVYDGCSQTGQAPRDQAAARSAPSEGETFTCGTTPGQTRPETMLIVAVGAVAAVRIARRRRRLR